MQLHTSHLLQISIQFKGNEMAHIANHGVRPQKTLSHASQQNDIPTLQVFILFQLVHLVFNARTHKIFFEFCNAVRKISLVGHCLLIVEIKGLRNIADLQLFSQDELSDVCLKIEVVLFIGVETAKNIDDICLGHKIAGASTSRQDFFIGRIRWNDLEKAMRGATTGSKD